MFHHILSEFMGTALMIVFGVGVHCDDVLKRTKYAGSGHMFAITTWALESLLFCSSLAESVLIQQWPSLKLF